MITGMGLKGLMMTRYVNAAATICTVDKLFRNLFKVAQGFLSSNASKGCIFGRRTFSWRPHQRDNRAQNMMGGVGQMFRGYRKYIPIGGN